MIYILLDHGDQRIIVGYTRNLEVAKTWYFEKPIVRSYEALVA